MGQTLTHGIYLPDEGERNCYNGLAGNWQLLDGAVGTVAEHTTALSGKAPLVHTHVKSDITDFPAYGTTAGTICEGNDSRLSDARTPVAHTHVTADVTDLLNTAHEWTKAQTYSDANAIIIKNNGVEIGNEPSAYNEQRFIFKDKNNQQIAAIKYQNQLSSNNVFNNSLELSATDKFKDGVRDATGTAITTVLRIGLWNDGTKYIYHDARWRTNLLPFTTNATDLGSSSYQWNNLYAKNYYYNGTAWGLDKINRWSKWQELRLAELEDYTLPSSEVTTDLFSWRGTTNFRGGFGHQYYTNGDEGCRLLLSSKDADNNAHLTAFRYKLNRAGTDSYFYGTGAQNFHLGTSTNKWKTINGINPGALSLPDNSGYTNISGNITDLTGAINNYTPPSDGYVMVNVNPNSNNYAYVSLERVTVRSSSETTSGKNAMATIPVIGGKSIDISVIGASIAQARFTPCLGNV